MELKRDIDPVLLAEMSKPVWYPTILVQIDWPTGFVRAHSGVGDMIFNGETFKGIGDFGEISIPQEEYSFVPQEATVSLTGPYADLLAEVSASAAGRRGDIWIGATAEPGGSTLVGEPYLGLVGAVAGDQLDPPANEGGKLVVTIRAGTHGRVSGAISHTDEEQQSVFPGDDLFARAARATANQARLPEW